MAGALVVRAGKSLPAVWQLANNLTLNVSHWCGAWMIDEVMNT